MEIEAKFVIPDRDAMLRLRRVVRLGPFVPGDTTAQRTVDVYLDTGERVLYRNGYACRLRRRADGCWLTVKGLGEVESAIHSRFECETALPAEATQDPATWPEGEGRDLVQGMCDGRPLEELFVVEQQRQVRPLRLEERLVAELSLDQVQFHAGEREQEYRCLEAELTGEGDVGHLRALTAHLRGTWGLEPEPRSKFELGLALLESKWHAENEGPETAIPNGEDEPATETAVAQRPPGEASKPAGRLTAQERARLERIVEEAADERDRRYAELVLGWSQRRSVRQMGEEIGFSQSWAYELIARFQEQRLGMFSAEPGRAAESEAVQVDGVEMPPEVPALTPSGDVESTSVAELCEQYQVDMAHARHVTEAALLLFDQTEPIHHLDEERRRLLAMAATLHDVGLEIDPEGHHARGRDIVLESRLDELTEMEQQMLAAGVFLHRRRIRRRKLETGVVASLPLGLRHDALVLAALIRVADGLDYSQSQSTEVEQVQLGSAAARVVVSGPSAEVDVARAQTKADLWDLLFGDTPFFFAVRGLAHKALQQVVEVEAASERTAWDAIAALKSPGIVADEPMSEAGRKVLAFHFARMLEHEPGTRAGAEIEELHDMRVATRRMRSALRILAPYYKARAIRPYIVGLRRTARVLGPVRDLDVFMEKAGRYLDGLGSDRAGELDVLLDAWRAQREQARTAMIETLDGAKHRDFVEAFRLFLETPEAGARQSTQIPPEPRLVRHVAPHLIYGRWASVQAFGPLLEGAPIAVLHALRIECKRLRYTLEFFREVLSARAGEVIEAVVTLQDHLGDLNDADVANAMLSDFLFVSRPGGGGERLIAPGVVAYLAAKQRELQTLMESFPQAWQAFNRPEVRLALADAVSVL